MKIGKKVIGFSVVALLATSALSHAGKFQHRQSDTQEGNGFFNPVDLIAFDLNGSYELVAQHDLIGVYSEGIRFDPLVMRLPYDKFMMNKVHVRC